MPEISPIQTLDGGGTSASGSASRSKSLDMNAFLRMFTTQLRYQDPTNPLESYELAAQLAQFSTVEKLTDISARLEEQKQYLVSLTNTHMVQMIGKEVTGAYDGIRVQDGSASKASYELSDQAATVTVKIYTENGVLVRTLEIGPQNPGRHDIQWDGKDQSGKSVPNGTYRFNVEPLASDGSKLEAQEYVQGSAFAFRLVNGVGYLVLGGENGLLLPASTITEVVNAG